MRFDLAHPAFAVISDGVDNSYGHPSPEVVERLEEHQGAVLRTDLDGFRQRSAPRPKRA
jgi:competence protein ComEC